jgi:hypothetical protein
VSKGVKDRVRMRIPIFQMLEKKEFLRELLAPASQHDPESQKKKDLLGERPLLKKIKE